MKTNPTRKGLNILVYYSKWYQSSKYLPVEALKALRNHQVTRNINKNTSSSVFMFLYDASCNTGGLLEEIFCEKLLKAHRRLFSLAPAAILNTYFYFVRVSWPGKKKTLRAAL